MKTHPRDPHVVPIAALSLSLALLALVSPLDADGSDDSHSKLWGRGGELWKPGGRLPDFSYAGYRRGEKPVPALSSKRTSVTVTDFGAVGDDEKDDTDSFRKAIVAGAGRVVMVPPGRYVISGFLDIRASGTVLRGGGSRRSILYFPTPLNEIEPNWGATTTGQKTSNYSWSGGFVRLVGRFSRQTLAEVTAPARRGERVLRVSSCDRLATGDEIRLAMRDAPERTLASHLYAGDPGAIDNLGSRSRESFSCRVAGVDASRRAITLDRALRTDVRLEWQPRLHPAASSVEEAGIESLGFDFPVSPYKGHFTELGHNAVAVGAVRNCWVRDIRISNADSGIFVRGENVTLRNIVIESERPRERSRKATGHHGVTLGGQDNLLADFDFKTRFMHDITVTRGSAGNVVAGGRGVDLALDHHRYGPHSNLFTDIDLGEGSRMFQSGGGAKLGRHSAAYETFWGVRSRRAQRWPSGWGPELMNLVGIKSDEPAATTDAKRWFEPIDPGVLRPRNLYRAQLERRLRSSSSN